MERTTNGQVLAFVQLEEGMSGTTMASPYIPTIGTRDAFIKIQT
jgi:hypothetical protein